MPWATFWRNDRYSDSEWIGYIQKIMPKEQRPDVDGLTNDFINEIHRMCYFFDGSSVI